MKKGSKKKVQKKILNMGKDRKISDSLNEVLYMWETLKLSKKEIANRRGTSLRSVYKLLNRLQILGYIDTTKKRGSKNTTQVGIKVQKKIIKNWCYHNLHFIIKPYYFFPRYHKYVGQYNLRHMDWKVKIHTETVEVQLMKGIRFSHQDIWESTRMAEESFNRLLYRIEKKYGFEVYKEGRCSIKLVNQHIARNPSELADARKGKYLQIKDQAGRVYFVIDKSDGAEHEYVHPNRALEDSEKIEPYLNDMLYKQPGKLSDLQHYLTESQKLMYNYFKGKTETKTETKSDLETMRYVIQESESISKMIKDMTEEVRNIRAMKHLSEEELRLVETDIFKRFGQ